MTKEILKGVNGIEFHMQYDGMLIPEHKKQILDKLNSSYANVRSIPANQYEPQQNTVLGQITALAMTCAITGCPATTITPGTTVSLTLIPTGGVPPYTYIWMLDDNQVGNAPTYSTSTLAAGTNNAILGTVIDSTYTYCYKICIVNVAAATVTICSWISGKGGPTAIIAFDIMTLVSAYSGATNLGFTVSAAYIMGAVAYYSGMNSNGNSLTGCAF